MSKKLKKTQDMLARHHRDGQRFVELMKESYDHRFGDEFWHDWKKWVEPAYGASTRPGRTLTRSAGGWGRVRPLHD